MRMLRPRSALLLVAAVLFLAGCGSDDAPTGTGGGGTTPPPNPTNPAVVALYNSGEAIQTTILGPNQAAYTSMGVLLPIIVGSIPAPSPIAAPGQDECLDPSLYGKTYGWLGDGYGETELTGAPETGVRFLLYPIDGTGNPNFSTSTGHFDIVCPPVALQAGIGLAVVWQGATVLDASLLGTGPYVLVTGSLIASNGTDVLNFDAELSISMEGNKNYWFSLANMPGGIGHWHDEQHTPSSNEIIATIDVGIYDPVYEWNANTQLNCTSAGAIEAGGILYFDTGLDYYHLACPSGTLRQATFTSANDCSWGGAGKIVLAGGDLAAITAFYATERGLFETVQVILDAASEDPSTM